MSETHFMAFLSYSSPPLLDDPNNSIQMFLQSKKIKNIQPARNETHDRLSLYVKGTMTNTSMSLSLSRPSKLENTWCIIWNGFKGHTTDEQPPYNYVPYNHHREMKRHKSANHQTNEGIEIWQIVIQEEYEKKIKSQKKQALDHYI